MPAHSVSPAAKVLLVDEDPDPAARMCVALRSCGCVVIAALASPLDIYRSVEAQVPDLIIIETDSPSRDTLESLAFVSANRHRPIVMFTGDRSGDAIRDAIAAGVSAYVVDGSDAARLAPILEVAAQRFVADQALRAQLAETREALAGRKWVDRAKGILMSRRNTDEETAFRELRRFAMDRGLSLADAAKRVIEIEAQI